MAFIFSTSHLPETRVRRPDHLEEDDDEDSLSPPPRAGMVRAFSHLPAKEETVDPAGPLSQRGAQALGRQLQRTETQETSTPHADGISAAKASGVFDVVRQQFNRDDSPHFMDEDGNLRPRDEARQQESPAPRDARSPQFGAGAPPRPAWSAGHAAAGADAYSGRSPRAPSSASVDTRPWYMPPFTPEDLHLQHIDDDDATGSHSALKGRPGAHDLVYRRPDASRPRPGLQDLLYRHKGSATKKTGHGPDRYLLQAPAKNKAPVQSQQGGNEPSHDRDFTAEQQKKFIEAMKTKALELYHHHENRVGEHTPAAATAKRDGKIVAYCNQYPSECVAAGYEAIGMPKTAQMIRDKTTKKDQAVHHLSKILHDRGWKSIFYNNDRTSPGAEGEHASDTGHVEKKGVYWGPNRTGADGKPKIDWMKIDGYKTDFSPGRPGYSDEVTEDLKKVEFAVVNGCRGRHGAVMSNGGTYDVHRSEPDVNHLYGKTDFNRTRGLLQSGLLLVPPGAHVPSHTPAK